MNLPRFFGEFNFSNKKLRIVNPELLNQLKNVLRLGKGGRLILCDGNLNEAVVSLLSLEKGFAEVEILEVRTNGNEPDVQVTLYCSILKKENFELATQKATEVGVSQIAPIISKRTVKLNFKEDRLRKIIKEAAEQSGRGRLPSLRSPLDFQSALDAAKENDANLFFDPAGEKIPRLIATPFLPAGRQVRKGEKSLTASGPLPLQKGEDKLSGKKIGIFIGPEGGWDEAEIALARERKFKIISLGKLTQRAETAAIVVSYLIAQHFTK